MPDINERDKIMEYIKIIKDDSWKNKCTDEERMNAYKPPINPITKICGNIALTYNGKIMTKKDNSYQPINSPANNYWTDITHGNGKYIAISSDNEWKKSRAITSVDGILWTMLNLTSSYKKKQIAEDNGTAYEYETNHYCWKSIMFYNKLNIFIAKDSQENIIWIDANTLKSRLFKYNSQLLAKKSLKKKKQNLIEERIIYWSFGSQIETS